MKPEIEDTDIIIRRVSNETPPALPDSEELTDDELEHVIGGAPSFTFNLWRVKTINERKTDAIKIE